MLRCQRCCYSTHEWEFSCCLLVHTQYTSDYLKCLFLALKSFCYVIMRLFVKIIFKSKQQQVHTTRSINLQFETCFSRFIIFFYNLVRKKMGGHRVLGCNKQQHCTVRIELLKNILTETLLSATLSSSNIPARLIDPKRFGDPQNFTSNTYATKPTNILIDFCIPFLPVVMQKQMHY